MASLFASSTCANFWHKSSQFLSQKPPEAEFSGSLCTVKNSIQKNRQFEVHRNKFVCLSAFKIPQKYTELTFKILEPFIEESNSAPKYGFRLGSKDFFVSSSITLDEWLSHLSSKCILKTFEEDFVIIKTIGQGSTSTVYLAEQLDSHKSFAVKCVNKQNIHLHPNGLNNLLEEIRILQRISNEFIAKLYFVYESTNFVYMIMEYLPHGDLYKRIQSQKKFDEDTCAKFLRNLLEALEYLHTNDIVHRDLKLENLLMAGENNFEFKIIDFGLAYERSDEQNTKCGSPGYVAPEMLWNKRYDNKIDIFSAGVVLYILLTGKHPFCGRSTKNVFKNNAECRYKISKQLSNAAADVIRLMMEPDPELRFNAKQLLEHPWLGFGKRATVMTCYSGISNVGSV